MTANDVIDRVREDLADTASSRWSDAYLLSCVVTALQDVVRYRKDLFIGTDGTLDLPAVDSAGDDVVLDTVWLTHLAHGASGYALQVDDADIGDKARGGQLLVLFDKGFGIPTRR